MKAKKEYAESVGEEAAKIVEDIVQQYQIVVHLTFDSKKKADITVNELILTHNPNCLKEMIESATHLRLHEVELFVGEAKIDLKTLDLKSKP